MVMLSYQDKLPRLPIPRLEDTLHKYLKSVRPFIRSGTEWDHTKCLVDKFAKPTRGPHLQLLLQEWARAHPTNWLSEWWLEIAYNGWREPLCVNSNYWIIFAHDPNAYDLVTHVDNAPTRGAVRVGEYGEFQIRRAAKLTELFLNVMMVINGGCWPVDKVHGQPLCMEQYRWVFGTTRIPEPGCDRTVRNDKASRHIVAMARDQLYRIEVFRPDGSRYPVGDIEDQLRAAVHHAASLRAEDLCPAVGVLTGGSRDMWAEAYAELTADPTNKAVLDLVKEANFVVCLDDTITLPADSIDIAQLTTRHHATDPGHNRWFDKTVCLVIDRNGVAGVCGEHSPCEALVPAIIYSRVMAEASLEKHAIRKGVLFARSAESPRLAANPQHLRFARTSPDIAHRIRAAENEIAIIAANSTSVSYHHLTYGADWIKRVAKTSPDAFVQMALQLAYRRLHRAIAPTYETASSRRFLHGRTETIRAATSEAAAFIEAMDDRRKSPDQKYQLLAAAYNRHARITRECSTGQGIDRHLLGLKIAYTRLAKDLAPEDRQVIEAFFSDPVFVESQTWRLSTSNLTICPHFIHTGFGAPVTERGYGINYILENNVLKFGIDSKTPEAGKGSNVYEFRKSLQKALDDMYLLCQEVNSTHKHITKSHM